MTQKADRIPKPSKPLIENTNLAESAERQEKSPGIPGTVRNRTVFPAQVNAMQHFRIRLLDPTGLPIQVISALAETDTIALVRAATLASDTGAAGYEVEQRLRPALQRARL